MKKYHLLSLPVFAILAIGIFFLSFGKESVNGETALPLSCATGDLSGNFDFEEKIAIFEGRKINIPLLAEREEEERVLAATDPNLKWIEIDLSEQRLRAWEGGNLFLETPISSGLPGTPTPQGEFRIWVKLKATKMSGGLGRYYYYLPNVPYVMYFQNSEIPAYKGYGLHGTYWHNDFGRPHSHGCVNLPTSIAERLYYWVTPILSDSKGSIFASSENPGTRVVIHE